MGCDIHMYIEYKKEKSSSWVNFGGKLNPGRDYLMFAIISGVRDYGKEYTMFNPKGLPSDLGGFTNAENLIYISDEVCDCGAEVACTLKSAIEWEKYGQKITYNQGKATWVTHPDWHSHSYLSYDEYKQVVYKYYSFQDRISKLEYKIVLDIMKSFIYNKCSVRIVFWFDN